MYPDLPYMTHNESVNIRVAPVNLCSKLVDYSLCDSDGDVSVLNDLGHSLDNRPAQITDKADSKFGFLHFQAIIAKKLEVGEGLS